MAQRVACSALTLVVRHYITNLSGIAGVALSSGGTSPMLPTFDTGAGCLLDRIGGVCPGLEWVVKRSHLTPYINKMVPEGPLPPHDRQLIVNYYKLIQYIDDFVGRVDFLKPFDPYIV